MGINQCAYPKKFTWDLFPSVSKTTFLAPNIYTNINIHQHKITQLNWIHLLHTYNI